MRLVVHLSAMPSRCRNSLKFGSNAIERPPMYCTIRILSSADSIAADCSSEEQSQRWSYEAPSSPRWSYPSDRVLMCTSPEVAGSIRQEEGTMSRHIDLRVLVRPFFSTIAAIAHCISLASGVGYSGYLTCVLIVGVTNPMLSAPAA